MNSKNVLRRISELRLGGPQSVDLDQSVPYHHFSSQSQQFVFLDYWQVLVKRRWLMLGSLVFMLAAAVLVSLRKTPMYQAAGQIMINRQNPNPLGLKESTSTDAVEDFDQTVDLATHVKILQSNSPGSKAVRRLVA